MRPFKIGQELNLERNPIYSGSVNGAKLEESVRTIGRVEYLDSGRVAIMFKGSKIWYSTNEGSEWIQSKNMRYRNLDFGGIS